MANADPLKTWLEARCDAPDVAIHTLYVPRRCGKTTTARQLYDESKCNLLTTRGEILERDVSFVTICDDPYMAQTENQEMRKEHYERLLDTLGSRPAGAVILTTPTSNDSLTTLLQSRTTVTTMDPHE